MSTQQDIYDAVSKNCPPMLNKENYIPWSSRLLRYAKSKSSGKLLVKSILEGSYQYRMIEEPGDPDHIPQLLPSSHLQTDDELTAKEAKQVEADDQAIQFILTGLPGDIYYVVDSCNSAKDIWNENRNVLTARDENNYNGNNAIQIRCYTFQGMGHYTRNCIVRPRGRNDAYLQTQLLVAQKEEAGMQLQADDLMVVASNCEEIEEVNGNCILMANLQQESTSGNFVDKAPVYYSNGSAELSKEKSTVSYLQEEREKLKSVFKIRENELFDKLIESGKRFKELDNILVQTGQSIQTIHMLLPKPDSFYHTEHKMALGYQNLFYLKQARKKQQSLYNANVLLEKHDPPAVYDSEETL
ncbi:hypothetical protein Tco_0537796 [Tanacetum coccineum]